tara:strand:+ start:81 stop:329 length:249 start_codon:yes stop_codon:yes gene_type:complete
LNEDFKKGDLVKLYSMYEAHIEEPAVVGIYLRTGQEAQFTFHEIVVVRENLWARPARSGGFVERYLANDFVMCLADEHLMKE